MARTLKNQFLPGPTKGGWACWQFGVVIKLVFQDHVFSLKTVLTALSIMQRSGNISFVNYQTRLLVLVVKNLSSRQPFMFHVDLKLFLYYFLNCDYFFEETDPAAAEGCRYKGLCDKNKVVLSIIRSIKVPKWTLTILSLYYRLYAYISYSDYSLNYLILLRYLYNNNEFKNSINLYF